MKPPQDIAQIFSLFHDGVIINHTFADTVLRLTIQIEYLAERIDPSFSQFTVVLYGVKYICFKTWPNRRENLHWS